jgi:hypothetical protein
MNYTHVEVRTALQKSIEKWEKLVNVPGTEEHGVRDCALCGLFSTIGYGCTGCPIREYTGKDSCLNTPYDDWLDATGFPCVNDNPRSDTAARSMLAFLKKLDKHYFEP